MPSEENKIARLVSLQVDLEAGKQQKDNEKISNLKSAIETLKKEFTEAESEQALEDASILIIKAKGIANRESVAKIETDILNLTTKIQNLSTLAGSEHIIPTLNQTLASNQLALQIIKNREETKKIVSLNNQKSGLSKPISENKLAPLDPARKTALTQLKGQIKLSNLTPQETLDLKKEVIRLMESKDLQKPLPWLTPKWYKPSEYGGQEYSNPDIFGGHHGRRTEAMRFHHRLNKLKRNLNIHLYPTYGKRKRPLNPH